MRDRIVEALGDLAHTRFLVYLMGPYTAFDPESVLDAAEAEGVADRWDARVYSYADRDDLLGQVRLFVRDLARREQHGNLPDLD